MITNQVKKIQIQIMMIKLMKKNSKLILKTTKKILKASAIYKSAKKERNRVIKISKSKKRLGWMKLKQNYRIIIMGILTDTQLLMCCIE